MKAQSIKDIKKRFKNECEWLLIEVTETDKATSMSTRGRLIAHSPVRDIIYKRLTKIRGRKPVLVDCSCSGLPKGTAAIF